MAAYCEGVPLLPIIELPLPIKEDLVCLRLLLEA